MEKTVKRAQEMVHELLGAGVMMKDIVSGTGVNPTTLGWIRKGRAEKIAERTFDRIWDYWSEDPRAAVEKKNVPGGLPEETPQNGPTLEGSKVEQAFQMVRDLLKKGKSSYDIVRGTGLASQTVSNLRNEKSKRVTNKVYDRLRDYWRQEMNGKSVEKPQGRTETDVTDFISHDHVPVNADAMNTVIDRLIGSFEAAVKELEGIRRALK